ncbi:MAG TPA: DMT family transporter [Myxococcota bacterium]|nr:DMT family transporter [Myxococcota bacterium]
MSSTVLHRPTGDAALGASFAALTMLLWSVLPFALAGALARIDPVTLTWARFVIASGALLGWLALRRGLPELRRLAGGGWRLLALAVLGLSVNYIAYLVGLHRTTPAGAQVLIQLAQVLLSLGGIFVFGERFTRVQWAGFVTLVLGLVTFSWAQLAQLASELAQYLSGIALIVFASVVWAGYGLAQKQLLVRLPSQPLMLLIYAGCALCFTPFADPRALAGLDAAGWALVTFCGANTLLGYGALAAALAHWEASRVSALLALGPLVTLAIAALAAGAVPAERLDAASWLGALCVVAGSIATSAGGQRQIPHATDEK